MNIIKINKQKTISFVIAYMVSFLGLLNGINAITNELGINSTVDTFVMYALMWGMAIFVWGCAINKCNLNTEIFLLILIFILLFSITILFFPENTKFIASSSYTIFNSPIVVFFVYSFTGYMAVRCLNDYQYLIKYLRFFSYATIVVSAIIFWGMKDTFANQYMSLSYNMLLQVCFLIVFRSQKKKLLDYIFIGVGMFIIIIGGARGALVGLVLVILICILGLQEDKISTKKIIIGISLLFGGILIILFYEQLLTMLIELVGKMGLISRNLELFLNASSDVSSGRFKMYSKMWDNINLFGHGLYGDRILLNGSYAHNLFFEWFMEFGVLGGVIFSIAYIILLVLGIKDGNDLSRRLLVVFIPNGFVGLMFSGSYLAQQPAFYILCGLCVNIILRERRRKLQ